MAEIKYIPVSKLWRHPDNPRKDLGDVTELAEADKDGCVVVRPCKGLSTKPDDGRQLVLEQAIAHLESLLRDHDFECEDCKRDHRELLELLVELKERRG